MNQESGITVGEALLAAEKDLKAAGIKSARLDAQILLETVTGQSREHLLAHGEDILQPKLYTDYCLLTTERGKHVPIAHLTGKREFYSLDFEITPDVLTPRVETEKMVDWAIKYAPKDSKLIDIGTGSGALAIAIKKHRPDLHVTATDIDPKIIAIATRNAAKHKVDVKFHICSLLDCIAGKFEAVVTNLPYLQNDAQLLPDVKHEPAEALFGGPDGLDLYRQLFEQLPEHLEKGGYLFTESDPWQQPALIKEAERIGLKVVEQDYFILGFKLT